MKSLTLVKNGTNISFSESLNGAISMLSNGTYDIIIKRHSERRSSSQNALMWMWFECIAQETGSERQQVHDYYCCKFIPQKMVVGKCTFFSPGKTSALDKDEFTLFLNKVQADAASEFGISLPTPEDRYYEQFYQTYKNYQHE